MLRPMKPHTFIAIIPARYASTRFPGKPLALLDGQPIIRRVYEQVSRVFNDVLVATDDERILQCVESFGGRAVMTGSHHRSGTDRCYEAYVKSGSSADIVVNVQGDEPFIQAEQLEAVMQCFQSDNCDIATLVKPFTEADGWEALNNPNSPKVVVSPQQTALYFSRSVIPYLRGVEQKDWLKKHTFYKHIGLYAYRAEVLQRLTSMTPTPLELAESLEQLRWLENGCTIRVARTEHETIGIDTPDDLRRAEIFLQAKGSTYSHENSSVPSL